MNKKTTIHSDTASATANSVVRKALRLLSGALVEKSAETRINKTNKQRVFQNSFDNSCGYCQNELLFENAVWDHAIPINQNHLGLNTLGNLVPCHKECNSQKAGMTHLEYFEKLKAERRYSRDSAKKTLNHIEQFTKKHGLAPQVANEDLKNSLGKLYDKYTKDAAKDSVVWATEAFKEFA